MVEDKEVTSEEVRQDLLSRAMNENPDVRAGAVTDGHNEFAAALTDAGFPPEKGQMKDAVLRAASANRLHFTKRLREALAARRAFAHESSRSSRDDAVEAVEAFVQGVTELGGKLGTVIADQVRARREDRSARPASGPPACQREDRCHKCGEATVGGVERCSSCGHAFCPPCQSAACERCSVCGALYCDRCNWRDGVIPGGASDVGNEPDDWGSSRVHIDECCGRLLCETCAREHAKRIHPQTTSEVYASFAELQAARGKPTN